MVWSVRMIWSRSSEEGHYLPNWKVTAHKFSKTAVAAIEEAGGSTENLE